MVLWLKNAKFEQVDSNTQRRILEYGKSLMTTHIKFANVTSEVILHSHAEEQSTYILKGKFKFFIEEKEYIVGPGDSLFFPSNVSHGCIILEPESELIDSFSPIRKDFL